MSEQGLNSAGRRVRAGSRRGAVLIEATLTLPLFLIFWFGIVDWGITYWMHETLVHRANTAVRQAVVRTWAPTEIRNMIVYGKTTATGMPFFGLSAAGADNGTGTNIDVKLRCLTSLSPALQEGDTCLDPLWSESQRWIEVVVHDYSWTHFTPFFAGTYRGRRVTVSLTTESMGVS
jgi:Flp pilus assembly protein TadG